MSDYQPPVSPGPAPGVNSTTAVISLIAGIAGLTIFPIIGSIIAVITGHIAKGEIKRSGGALGGDGLATWGLVLGYIGIGFLVLGLCFFGLALAGMCTLPFIFQSDTSSLLLAGARWL